MTEQIPPSTFAPTVDVIVEVDPVRCEQCNQMLAELATAPWRIKCRRCGSLNWATADGTVNSTEPTKATRSIERNKGASNG